LRDLARQIQRELARPRALHAVERGGNGDRRHDRYLPGLAEVRAHGLGHEERQRGIGRREGGHDQLPAIVEAAGREQGSGGPDAERAQDHETGHDDREGT
jgi:hypothetical protein